MGVGIRVPISHMHKHDAMHNVPNILNFGGFSPFTQNKGYGLSLPIAGQSPLYCVATKLLESRMEGRSAQRTGNHLAGDWRRDFIMSCLRHMENIAGTERHRVCSAQ